MPLPPPPIHCPALNPYPAQASIGSAPPPAPGLLSLSKAHQIYGGTQPQHSMAGLNMYKPIHANEAEKNHAADGEAAGATGKEKEVPTMMKTGYISILPRPNSKDDVPKTTTESDPSLGKEGGYAVENKYTTTAESKFPSATKIRLSTPVAHGLKWKKYRPASDTFANITPHPPATSKSPPYSPTAPRAVHPYREIFPTQQPVQRVQPQQPRGSERKFVDGITKEEGGGVDLKSWTA